MRIKKQYGNPIALVHDMGTGIMGAVAVVFKDVPDYICHFHFLRNIGKDLLLEDHKSIMSSLKKHKIRGSLRQKLRYLENKLGEHIQILR
jgi:transposase-like protein